MRYLAFLVVALALAVEAQDVSPPDGAHLVGSPAPIILRWKGTAPEYRLEVTAGRALVYAGVVQGHSLTLPLKPGPLYRWKVSPGQAGLFQDSSQYYSFQFAEKLEYRFPGAAGQTGMNGPQPGAGGQPGGPGSAGQDVLVELVREGDFIRVTLQAGSTRQQLMLVPGSQPLLISACGGPGGNGGAGAPGLAGSSNARTYPNPYAPRQPVVITPPGNGGNGGNGGDGGPGGTVTVKAGPGLDPRALVQADVTGGAGGRGGSPGQGGGPAPAYGTGYSGGPGAPGQPGAPGRAGPAGQVR